MVGAFFYSPELWVMKLKWAQKLGFTLASLIIFSGQFAQVFQFLLLINHAISAGDMAPLIEHLPSKSEDLNSNPSTNKKKATQQLTIII
jgi:hypothetical protein